MRGKSLTCRIVRLKIQAVSDRQNERWQTPTIKTNSIPIGSATPMRGKSPTCRIVRLKIQAVSDRQNDRWQTPPSERTPSQWLGHADARQVSDLPDIAP